ncbi:MAG: hypothetical protein IGS49_30010 [Chlorogloeopsis fritschii C42_A2020_084]|uniref:hypothetical protein n=1 Tax=Chlorogloeopsis fritschii TaxID=1124 RepID=UPI0019DB2D13|nr:hypothetical protein [Chlorogloeopsis fritschii]MBF2009544.1 hypothetical protein [Chlorogloeopsis fritschii C42_A2020_084]
MSIIICPGIHEPKLTENFTSSLSALFTDTSTSKNSVDILIYPTVGYSSLSAFHILQFLSDRLGNEQKAPVMFISFSAGVVGAIAAASLWQILGGYVKAFIAIDGWGVPLVGNFPIHRMSHDYFTHWSSKILGCGHNNFYADPPVEHLDMWRSPQTVQGWWVDLSVGESQLPKRLSAIEFLYMLFMRYEEN